LGGGAHDERHVAGTGEEGGLAEEAVVAQMLAVVGVKDDGRVVVKASGAQLAQEAA